MNRNLDGILRNVEAVFVLKFLARWAYAAMTPEAVSERARAAIGEMGGRWLLLGPDCSVNPDTPEAVLRAGRG